MNNTYLRGDMYYADLNPVIGSEQGGYRPVLIIQNNKGNKNSPTIVVAAITSKVGIKPKLPTHYFINAESGLEFPSIVLLEQIRTIDKKRLTDYIGRLDEHHIQGINHALAVSTGLAEPSDDKMVMCLCSTCVSDFSDAGSFHVRRVNRYQQEKDTCTYCNSRSGFDYAVVRKEGENHV